MSNDTLDKYIEHRPKVFDPDKILVYLNALDKNKINYIKIREPGGSFNSEKIRRLILNKNSNFNIHTDLFLYSASRSENIQKLKKFHKKKIILIDRFIDSTIAYQHFGLGVDLNLIKKIHSVILNDFKIDFTFLNIVNNKNMLSRLRKRNKLNRYDKFSSKFYEKVQKGFLKIIRNKKFYEFKDHFYFLFI